MILPLFRASRRNCKFSANEPYNMQSSNLINANNQALHITAACIVVYVKYSRTSTKISRK